MQLNQSNHEQIYRVYDWQCPITWVQWEHVFRKLHNKSVDWGRNKCRPKPLLHGWNSFLLLDPFLDPINCISWFDVDFYLLSSKSFHLDHRTSPKPQNQMKCRFLLDVIISQSTAIFQLLARKYQSLLVRRNTFFVLAVQNINIIQLPGWTKTRNTRKESAGVWASESIIGEQNCKYETASGV